MTEVIKKLADAEVGDLVWMYDNNANAYDEAGKYIGRGAWKKQQITGKTRLSLECYQTKFTMDGVARVKNGFAPGYSIYGQEEKDAQEWIDKNRYRLASFIQGERDVVILKQVAALVGYEEKA